jgi:hypothetical protein
LGARTPVRPFAKRKGSKSDTKVSQSFPLSAH